VGARGLDKVVCERCGREIKAGVLSSEKVWTVHIGPLKGKRICNDCYLQIQPELEKLLQNEIVSRPRPILEDDTRLKMLIGNLLNESEGFLKGINWATFEYALTDDRTLWNIQLLRSVISLLKASSYYSELVLRKLDALEKAVSKK